MRRYLLARRVPAQHLIVDSNSADTIQNAVYTAQRVLALQWHSSSSSSSSGSGGGGGGGGVGGGGGKDTFSGDGARTVRELVVVTSAFHVRRAQSYFEPVLRAYGVAATITFEGAELPPPLLPPLGKAEEVTTCKGRRHSAAVAAEEAKDDEHAALQARKERLLQERSAPVLSAVVRKIQQAQTLAMAQAQAHNTPHANRL